MLSVKCVVNGLDKFQQHRKWNKRVISERSKAFIAAQFRTSTGYLAVRLLQLNLLFLLYFLLIFFSCCFFFFFLAPIEWKTFLCAAVWLFYERLKGTHDFCVARFSLRPVRYVALITVAVVVAEVKSGYTMSIGSWRTSARSKLNLIYLSGALRCAAQILQRCQALRQRQLHYDDAATSQPALRTVIRHLVSLSR